MAEGLLLSLLAGCLYALAGIRIQRWNQRGALKCLQDAATSCGLAIEESSPLGWWRAQVKARAEPLEVKIELFQSSRPSFRITVAVPGPPGFSAVGIVPEEGRLRGAHEVEIGDGPFDSAFHLEGPTRLLHALLDAEVRHLLISVNADSRLEIVGGELRALVVHPYQVADILRLLLDIGRRFAQPLDALPRLAENARSDPDAGVRLGNLLVLAREAPADPVTAEALRAACLDPSPEVRLRAAQELGAEGLDVLLELAKNEVNDTWSARAVSALGRNLPFDLATDILKAALRRRRRLTARACLEALGRSRSAEAVHLLAKVLAREEGTLAAAAALALGMTGSPAAEPPLILALQHESTEVLTAVAIALGEVGTAAAVLPLKEAAKRSAHHPELLRATRQAIAAIQIHLPGASPGQLSLSRADAGHLSLAQAEAGELSLAGDAAGQLSLPAAEAGQLSLDGAGGQTPR